jgi:hypothetical protein
MTSFSQEEQVSAFAKRAALSFKNDPNMATFGGNPPEPGELFAVRWGMGEDCVLVFRLDPDFVPVNFQEAIKRV